MSDYYFTFTESVHQQELRDRAAESRLAAEIGRHHRGRHRAGILRAVRQRLADLLGHGPRRRTV
ncbi:hypothetical protein ACQBAR_00390 [Propionibacteriaceae bacterium Y1685]|uniref:hypothetical protein n=1 Tax=Microlunatus sp. Y1700 TaxID=3418487 RepID=UPI003B80483C